MNESSKLRVEGNPLSREPGADLIGAARAGSYAWRPGQRARLQAVLPALLFSACLGLAVPEAVRGAPEGGRVMAGEGSIKRDEAAGRTVVKQLGRDLVVDWDSFDVGSGESVHFDQPGRTASVLNRIWDVKPSEIHGSLTALGRVWLLNGHGVYFRPGASVSVGGLVASSLDLDPGEFMAGRYVLQRRAEAGPGKVLNQGLLEASRGGFIGLAGAEVSNEGLILAHAGRVEMATGERVEVVDFDGDGLLKFEVREGVLSGNGKVDNSGGIHAPGGEVLLRGGKAREVLEGVVNNSGVIRAGRVNRRGGKVVLESLTGGVENSGELDVSGAPGGQGGELRVSGAWVRHEGRARASGDEGGGSVELEARGRLEVAGEVSAASGKGQGGRLVLEGERVELKGNSLLDASGAMGGGEILVGGGAKGADAGVRNAEYTKVERGARLLADAREKGDGGEVVVWADEETRYQGTVSARGGPSGGDGGFAEISAKQLWYDGHVDLSALRGAAGTLLLDPVNVTICKAHPDDCKSETANLWTDTQIQQLLATQDLEISTDGDGNEPGNIQVGSGVIVDWGTGTNKLTLDAANDIVFQGGTFTASSGGETKVRLELQLVGNLDLSGVVGLSNLRVHVEGTGGTQVSPMPAGLTGLEAPTQYEISGLNEGGLSAEGANFAGMTLTFNNVGRLVGGAADDVFRFQPSGGSGGGNGCLVSGGVVCGVNAGHIGGGTQDTGDQVVMEIDGKAVRVTFTQVPDASGFSGMIELPEGDGHVTLSNFEGIDHLAGYAAAVSANELSASGGIILFDQAGSTRVFYEDGADTFSLAYTNFGVSSNLGLDFDGVSENVRVRLTGRSAGNTAGRFFDGSYMLGGNTRSFVNAPGMTGGAGNDFLEVGYETGGTFRVTESDGGSYTAENSMFTFGSVENLLGSDGGEDTFEFGDAGALGGVLDGRAGTDTLSISDSATQGYRFTVQSGDDLLQRGPDDSLELVAGFMGVEDLRGGRDVSGVFIIREAHTGSLYGGGSSNMFMIEAPITGSVRVQRGDVNTFKFTDAGSVTGEVVGVSGFFGQTLDFSALTNAVRINVVDGSRSGPNVHGDVRSSVGGALLLNFQEIGSVIGSSDTGDLLSLEEVVEADGMEFMIDEDTIENGNLGSRMKGIGSITSSYTLDFGGIENIHGSNQGDLFVVFTAFGVVDGKGGNDEFQIGIGATEMVGEIRGGDGLDILRPDLVRGTNLEPYYRITSSGGGELYRLAENKGLGAPILENGFSGVELLTDNGNVEARSVFDVQAVHEGRLLSQRGRATFVIGAGGGVRRSMDDTERDPDGNPYPLLGGLGTSTSRFPNGLLYNEWGSDVEVTLDSVPNAPVGFSGRASGLQDAAGSGLDPFGFYRVAEITVFGDGTGDSLQGITDGAQAGAMGIFTLELDDGRAEDNSYEYRDGTAGVAKVLSFTGFDEVRGGGGSVTHSLNGGVLGVAYTVNSAGGGAFSQRRNGALQSLTFSMIDRLEGGAAADTLELDLTSEEVEVRLEGTPDADGFQGKVVRRDGGQEVDWIAFSGVDVVSGDAAGAGLSVLGAGSLGGVYTVDSVGEGAFSRGRDSALPSLPFSMIDRLEGGAAADTLELDLTSEEMEVRLEGAPDADGFQGEVVRRDGGQEVDWIAFSGINRVSGDADGAGRSVLVGGLLGGVYTVNGAEGGAFSQESGGVSRSLAFSMIDRLEGGAATDTLELDLTSEEVEVRLEGAPDADGFQGEVVRRDGGQEVDWIAFSGINRVSGDAAGAGRSVLVGGGLGAARYTVNSAGGGTFSQEQGGSLPFSMIDRLEGGAAADTLELDLTSEEVEVRLEGAPDADGFQGEVVRRDGGQEVDWIAFSGINRVSGDAAGAGRSVLVGGGLGAARYTVNSAGGGTFSQEQGGSLPFSMIDRLEGGAAADTLELDLTIEEVEVRLEGTPDADGFQGEVVRRDGGQEVDWIAFSGVDVVSGDAAGAGLSVLGAGALGGVYTVNGAEGGAFSQESGGVSRSLAFSMIDRLEGGAATDTLELDLTSEEMEVRLEGAPDADGFQGEVVRRDGGQEVDWIAFSGINRVSGDADGAGRSVLVGGLLSGTYTVNGAEGGAFSQESGGVSRSLAFSMIDRLEGGAAADTLELDLTSEEVEVRLEGAPDADGFQGKVVRRDGGQEVDWIAFSGINRVSGDAAGAGRSVLVGGGLGAARYTVNSAGGGTFSQEQGGSLPFSMIDRLEGGAAADTLELDLTSEEVEVRLEGAPDADGFQGEVVRRDGGQEVDWIAFSGINRVSGDADGAGRSVLVGGGLGAARYTVNSAGGGTFSQEQGGSLPFSMIDRLEGGAAADTLELDLTIEEVEVRLEGTPDADGFQGEVVRRDGGQEVDWIAFSGVDVVSGDAAGDGRSVLRNNLRSNGVLERLENLEGADAGTGTISRPGTPVRQLGYSNFGERDKEFFILDLSGLSAALTVTLSGMSSGGGFSGSYSAGADSGRFNRLLGVKGRPAAGDTLEAGLSSATEAAAFDLGSGDYHGYTVGGGMGFLFSGMENLQGGAGTDTFTLDIAHAGDLRGAEGTDTFTINEAFTGDMSGGAGADTFTINAEVTGNVLGGAARDTFGVGASVSGMLSGEGGDDIFTVSGAASGNMDGGPGSDEFIINEAFTGDVSGGTEADIFTIGARVQGAVRGGAGDDWFTLSPGGCVVNSGGVCFDATGMVYGGAGEDTLTGGDVASDYVLLVDNGILSRRATSNEVTGFVEIENLVGGMMDDGLRMGALGQALRVTFRTSPVPFRAPDADGYSGDVRPVASGVDPSPVLVTFRNINMLQGPLDHVVRNEMSAGGLDLQGTPDAMNPNSGKIIYRRDPNIDLDYEGFGMLLGLALSVGGTTQVVVTLSKRSGAAFDGRYEQGGATVSFLASPGITGSTSMDDILTLSSDSDTDVRGGNFRVTARGVGRYELDGSSFEFSSLEDLRGSGGEVLYGSLTGTGVAGARTYRLTGLGVGTLLDQQDMELMDFSEMGVLVGESAADVLDLVGVTPPADGGMRVTFKDMPDSSPALQAPLERPNEKGFSGILTVGQSGGTYFTGIDELRGNEERSGRNTLSPGSVMNLENRGAEIVYNVESGTERRLGYSGFGVLDGFRIGLGMTELVVRLTGATPGEDGDKYFDGEVYGSVTEPPVRRFVNSPGVLGVAGVSQTLEVVFEAEGVFTVDGEDAGSYRSMDRDFAFVRIESLGGGAGNEDFIVLDGGSWRNQVAGGAGEDWLILKGGNSGADFVLSALGTGSLARDGMNLGFSGMEHLEGTGGVSNILRYGAGVTDDVMVSLSQGRSQGRSRGDNEGEENSASGFGGSASYITSFKNFAEVRGGNGGMDLLSAGDFATGGTFELTGAGATGTYSNPGLLEGPGPTLRSLDFSAFEHLEGGGGADTFRVGSLAARVPGELRGGGGADLLDLSRLVEPGAPTWLVSLEEAVPGMGFSGAYGQGAVDAGEPGNLRISFVNAQAGRAFTGIDEVRLSEGGQPSPRQLVALRGVDAAGSFVLNGPGTVSYSSGGVSLGLRGVNRLEGGSLQDLLDVSALQGPLTISLAQDQGAGDVLSYYGSVDMGAAVPGGEAPVELVRYTRIESYKGGELAHLVVQGSGVSVRAPNRPNGRDLVVNPVQSTLDNPPDGADLVSLTRDGAGNLLPTLNEFLGPVLIGGTLFPAQERISDTDVSVESELPLSLQPSLAESDPAARERRVEVNRLRIEGDLETRGELYLAGSDIELAADLGVGVTTPGDLGSAAGSDAKVVLVAVGTADQVDDEAGRNPGDIVVELGDDEIERTIYAGLGDLIANNGIQNADALVLNFDGGVLRTAVSPSESGDSNPSLQSQVTPEGLTELLRNYLNVLNLDAAEFVVILFNPTTQLSTVIGRLYLDLGLFVEELSLYGLEGSGLALFYSQCEEVEGCVPTVTLEQLEELIESLGDMLETLAVEVSTEARLKAEVLGLRLRRAQVLMKELRIFMGLDAPEGLEEEDDGFDPEDFPSLESAVEPVGDQAPLEARKAGEGGRPRAELDGARAAG